MTTVTRLAPWFAFDERPDTVVGSLKETIEAIVGKAALFDMSFPSAAFAGCYSSDCVQMLGSPRSNLESAFLLKFRQAGGHSLISAYDQNEEDIEQLSHRSSKDGAVIIIGLASLDDTKSQTTNAKAIFLVPLSLGGADALDDSEMMPGYRRLDLIDRKAVQSYMLFLPLVGEWRDTAKSDIANPLRITFDSGGRNVVIDGQAIIHDGGYVSEGDSKYSWLWTGPSTHFRLIVPQIPGDGPSLAELCIPRAEQPSTLDQLVVQLNGRPVSYQLDRWSDSSGKVTLSVPGSNDYNVLTLIVPTLTHNPDTGRLLGLCIDKIILSS